MKKVFVIITVFLILLTAMPVSANVCGKNHFMKYTVTKEPTYTEEGEQIGVCVICGYEDIVIIPTLKLPDVEWKISYSTLLLENLYGVKDIFIASGTNTTYREVKNNLIYGLTAARLNGNTSYSYIFRDKGMHTVYIRFNDTRADKLINVNVHVTEPSFSYGNGTLTVGNIEGAKVIRAAEGEHDTVSSMKASGTIVNYTGRIINAESYTIKFKHNGVYTIAVEYNSGYTMIYKWPVYGVL